MNNISGKKILVIEDDKLIQANILELLRSEGFSTFQASDGLAGVQLAQEHLPDLIVSDVMMPQLDGFEVLTQLRRSANTATIPFIFLTARVDRAALRQGMNLGADDFLTKPFTRAELLEVIKVRLNKQAAIAEQYGQELRETEERLNSSLFYDSLTELPNLVLLRQRLNWLIEAMTPPTPLALLSLDLDRFNRIVDSMGYAQGDALLQAVATRLQECVNSYATVARLQGSQFAILLPAADRVEASNLAGTLLERLSQSFVIEGRELFITASVGLAFHPGDGSGFDELLRNADAALSHAREIGGNTFQYYTPSMSARFFEQVTLHAGLRTALQQGQLEVQYQPQLDLRSGKIVGAEALVRWTHPERGPISPVVFIPLAEETNLIIPLSNWVLRTACIQAKTWLDAGYGPLRMAVNLSVRQLEQADLGQKIVEVLAETGLPADCLELELTESVFMQDIVAAGRTLGALRDLGIRIAIDDFGTGYSSLSQLRHLPFDTLKIDRSFVSNVVSNAETAAITRTIMQLAHNLHLNIVAEGVETPQELAFLSESGCDEMQGFLFSPALPSADFEKLLKAGTILQLQPTSNAFWPGASET